MSYNHTKLSTTTDHTLETQHTAQPKKQDALARIHRYSHKTNLLYPKHLNASSLHYKYEEKELYPSPRYNVTEISDINTMLKYLTKKNSLQLKPLITNKKRKNCPKNTRAPMPLKTHNTSQSKNHLSTSSSHVTYPHKPFHHKDTHYTDEEKANPYNYLSTDFMEKTEDSYHKYLMFNSIPKKTTLCNPSCQKVSDSFLLFQGLSTTHTTVLTMKNRTIDITATKTTITAATKTIFTSMHTKKCKGIDITIFPPKCIQHEWLTEMKSIILEHMPETSYIVLPKRICHTLIEQQSTTTDISIKSFFSRINFVMMKTPLTFPHLQHESCLKLNHTTMNLSNSIPPSKKKDTSPWHDSPLLHYLKCPSTSETLQSTEDMSHDEITPDYQI